MHAIWKYELTRLRITFFAPAHSQILTVQSQNNIPVAWLKVDPDEEKNQEFTIELFATGEQYNESKAAYISTFQTVEGLVFHAFQIK